MPSKTLAADKSSLFGVTGSTELGGGADKHLPVGGPWSGYTFTSAVRFALDWSGVRRITSATLRLRTSSQVHIGFSSSPDIYVARATADWTANSSSGSSDGGSGWSTSPTVYPGPASTTTGRVSKRAPTSEGTDLLIDITAIVRAWAPASVEGGGAAANYGVLLSRVASGDVTEFASYREPSTSLRPYITLVYESDTPPPAPTITAPTAGQIVTTLRPTLSATAVDPDGDPLTNADVEVRKAGSVVYSSVGFTAGIGATTISHTPTADLPSGDLTVRFRAKANGVYGAWSAELAFVVDRPPSVTGFSAPVGNIANNRRPVHTWSSADPDADPLQAWDLQVYATTDGSTPVGSPVYSVAGQTSGIAGYSVSHTPTADLPGGPLLSRARVKARGVWSAWSAYQPFTIVLASSTVVWTAPGSIGAGLFYRANQFSDLAVAVGTHQMRTDLTLTPPAGKTLTASPYTITQIDASGSTPAGTVIASGNIPGIGSIPNGGAVSIYGTVRPNHESIGTRWRIDVTVNDSGGGQTIASRVGGVSYAEWFGSIALGDSASAVAVAETIENHITSVPGQVGLVWYRAQSSPSAAAGAAPWRPNAELGTLAGELPATNAYLGIRVRLNRLAPPSAVLPEGADELAISWRGLG